jgi:hypothetical protein
VRDVGRVHAASLGTSLLPDHNRRVRSACAAQPLANKHMQPPCLVWANGHSDRCACAVGGGVGCGPLSARNKPRPHGYPATTLGTPSTGTRTSRACSHARRQLAKPDDQPRHAATQRTRELRSKDLSSLCWPHLGDIDLHVVAHVQPPRVTVLLRIIVGVLHKSVKRQHWYCSLVAAMVHKCVRHQHLQWYAVLCCRKNYCTNTLHVERWSTQRSVTFQCLPCDALCAAAGLEASKGGMYHREQIASTSELEAARDRS